MAKSTRLWYLVPILFGIIGGLIGYVALKNDEPKKAKTLLYIGIGLFALGMVMYVVFFLAALVAIA